MDFRLRVAAVESGEPEVRATRAFNRSPFSPASRCRHKLHFLDRDGTLHHTYWYRGRFRDYWWGDLLADPCHWVWMDCRPRINARPLIFLGWTDDREPFPMDYRNALRDGLGLR